MNKAIFFVVLAVCGYWTMRVVDAPVTEEPALVEELHAMEVDHLENADWGQVLE